MHSAGRRIAKQNNSRSRGRASARSTCSRSNNDCRPPVAGAPPRVRPPDERSKRLKSEESLASAIFDSADCWPFLPVPLKSRTVKTGQVISERYRLLRLLDVGGMGEVWAARNILTKKN